MALHYAKKIDLLLLFFVIFNLINTLLFIYGYLNWSFDMITVIFCAGFCNLLFALFMSIRSGKNKYQYDYGPIGCAEANYYKRTIGYGALFIVIDFAIAIGIFGWCMYSTVIPKISSEEVAACRDSLVLPSSYTLDSVLKYGLNYGSCYLGESNMFTLVGVVEYDFTVSLLQKLLRLVSTSPTYFYYALYLSAAIVLVPFIWLFYRMIHLFNCMRKEIEP